MSSQDMTNRRNLINTIKTPLGFFSLIVLVTESLLGGLVLVSSGIERTFLIYAIVGILILLILIVASIAIFKPEALWGKRYSALEESFAAGLGEDLYTALDGSLTNLEETEREEAYGILRDIILSSPHVDTSPKKKFCEILVKTIIRRAKLKDKWPKPKGIVEQ